jgi:hypothetical protein
MNFGFWILDFGLVQRAARVARCAQSNIENPESTIICACALGVLCGASALPPETQPAPLKLVQTIELPTVEGRIDHMAWDSQRNRLLIAALGNNTLEIVDLNQGKAIDRIARLQKPQGVLYLPEYDNIVIANGGDGSCRFYSAATLEIRAKAKGFDDADNVRSDAPGHQVLLGHGSGAITILNPGDSTVIRTVNLHGHPESFQSEAHGPRTFINVPEPAGGGNESAVEVIDRQRGEPVARWPLTGHHANFPMALVEDDHRLLIACRNPAEVLVIDTDSGKIIGSAECDGDVDDMFIDQTTGFVFVSCGSGNVDVIQRRNRDDYKRMAQVPTASGARTCLLVPQQHRLYVAAPRRSGKEARILVFELLAPPASAPASSRPK